MKQTSQAKSRSLNRALGLTLSSIIAASICAPYSVLAASEDDGSLENMWQEQSPAPTQDSTGSGDLQPSKKPTEVAPSKESTTKTVSDAKKEAERKAAEKKAEREKERQRKLLEKKKIEQEKRERREREKKEREAAAAKSKKEDLKSSAETPKKQEKKTEPLQADLKNAPEKAEPPKNTAATVQAAPVAPPNAVDAPGANIPVEQATTASSSGPFTLCTVKELKDSDFLKVGGWPGIGPFKPDDALKDNYLDEANNRMKLEVKDDKITALQLDVQGKNKNDFLSLEMTADFLLESLGAASNKIADFNRELENQQRKLSGADKEPIAITTGRYDVAIARSTGTEQTPQKGYVIKVKSNASEQTQVAKPATKIASATLPKAGIQSTALDPQKIAKTPPSQTPPKKVIKDDGNRFTIHTPPPQTTGTGAASNGTSTGQGTTGGTNPAASNGQTQVAVKPSSTDLQPTPDLLKGQFTRLIQAWQNIKRIAVKTRQSENLTKILGGKALSKQSTAVKWLLDNHRFYEMTPLALEVSGYKAVEPDRQYEVTARIKERQKYIDANTMNVLKDVEQNYDVVYTVEKVRGGWLIIDSKALPKK